MKKLAIPVMILLALLLTRRVDAQIQYQTAFSYSGIYTQLEKAGYKFYLMDVNAEQCRIYNTDYSIWKTMQLNIPNNRWLSDVQFLSQNLFDTDDGVELLYVYYQYVQTTTSYYYIYTTCVIDDNGSILLEVPGGSWTEIKNLEGDGSRMMVYVYDYSVYPYTVQTRIYKLPGQVTGIPELPASGEEFKESMAFPNPSSTSFHIRIPGTIPGTQATIVVLDSRGKLIIRQPVSGSLEEIDLKSLGCPSGTYYMRLETAKLQTRFQKIVLLD